jgi:hypothetical protein
MKFKQKTTISLQLINTFAINIFGLINQKLKGMLNKICNLFSEHLEKISNFNTFSYITLCYKFYKTNKRQLITIPYINVNLQPHEYS